MTWQIEALGADHEQESFYSGYGQLDDYIKKYASQHIRKHFSRTFVAVAPGTKEVLGFYTLSASSVDFAHVPEKMRKKLPRYPVPVALLGKLAVDRRTQGRGLGTFLLMDALYRVIAVAEEMAVFAVVVNAIDESAKAFYLTYGFQPFQDEPLHLFLPLSTIKKLF